MKYRGNADLFAVCHSDESMNPEGAKSVGVISGFWQIFQVDRSNADSSSTKRRQEMSLTPLVAIEQVRPLSNLHSLHHGEAMSTDNPIKTAHEGVALVGEILKAAGNNPQVKEAGQNLGQTAVTITKAINNALMPLAAVNFAFDKARNYFAERFQQDISAKTAAIPPEQVVEPKPSIAGPALQGLAFTHEEPNLKEMYLSLIATSMDGRVAANAHPAFVEVIRQLSSEDARLIRSVLLSASAIPIVEVRLTTVDQPGFRTLARHLLNLTNTETKAPAENAQLPAIVDNWVRLGLVTVDYMTKLTDETTYHWVDLRPEVIRLRQFDENEKKKIEITRGVLERTAFGVQFAKAVNII